MQNFIPFIHKINKSKKDELQPLYIEIEQILIPPYKEEAENDVSIIIIQL